MQIPLTNSVEFPIFTISNNLNGVIYETVHPIYHDAYTNIMQ